MKYLVIFLSLIIGCGGIAYLILFKPVDGSIQSIILWITAMAIFWYTWETHELAVETRRMRKWAASENSILKKQNITNIRPYLRLQKEDGEDDKLLLANEGKGVAVNLRPVYIKDGVRTNLLEITAMAASPNSYTRSFIKKSMGLNLNPESNYSVEIKYKDVEGRKYIVIFKTNINFNDKFEIFKQEEDISKK